MYLNLDNTPKNRPRAVFGADGHGRDRTCGLYYVKVTLSH